ncbi:MAG: BACON domain-containing protein [Alistipes sp.]|nr:BACON domain-containing protein [Alistipes sp.]
MKKSLKYFAILALSVIAFAACKEETPYICEGESGDIYVKFGGTGTTDTRLLVTTDGYIGETYAVSVTYDMYTNADEWQIVPDYSECYDPEYEWITSWPSEGNYDGRFTLNFQANSRQGDTRFAKVNIVSHGQVIQTIDIEQDKAPNTQFYIQPFLQVQSFTASGKYEDGENAGKELVKTIPLDSNVAWSARIDDDANGDPVEWIKVSNVTKAKFDISVEANTTGEERQGTITVYQNTNGNNNIVVTVKQAAM